MKNLGQNTWSPGRDLKLKTSQIWSWSANHLAAIVEIQYKQNKKCGSLSFTGFSIGREKHNVH
jgi:hypothetical protein